MECVTMIFSRLGGLFSSTLLNGFVVPVIYLINSKSKKHG